MITSQAPGFELAEYILSVAARAADRPRPIDRYIDYFGDAVECAGRGETVTTVRVAG